MAVKEKKIAMKKKRVILEERENLMCFYTFSKVQVNLTLVGFSLVD